MRKFIVPLVAGAFAVSACATSPYGYGGGGGYGGDPLGGLLGSILGGSTGSNQNLTRFQQEAVNACGQEASRYGRVQISDVRQPQQDVVQVYGQVQTQQGYGRQFACAYRSDGRIVDFQMN